MDVNKELETKFIWVEGPQFRPSKTSSIGLGGQFLGIGFRGFDLFADFFVSSSAPAVTTHPQPCFVWVVTAGVGTE
ncbi:MAG TPA: hypothetical protein DCS07_12605 [Bdellovibrionales bacterium]|nr:MAG: hypothetical protein A2Z97_08410 [Bdellovibrionales bacterium GWB1_52_6]OFZ33610.1 MAG: hypothetical protein A2070_11545 [Bdellovibrionales bacterium GWC1_52_8]HAR43451.1 hypothetical protein [Bdellovibrionales bacterium]HCM39457.1 hypothetical protein [Bdellovibrionales bacterium]